MEMTYTEHRDNFRAHLNEMREAIANERFEEIDPLSIDTTIRKRIWLTFGGPNVFIDIFFDSDNDITGGTYVHRWGNDRVEYPLELAEAEEIAEIYCLSEM